MKNARKNVIIITLAVSVLLLAYMGTAAVFDHFNPSNTWNLEQTDGYIEIPPFAASAHNKANPGAFSGKKRSGDRPNISGKAALNSISAANTLNITNRGKSVSGSTGYRSGGQWVKKQEASSQQSSGGSWGASPFFSYRGGGSSSGNNSGGGFAGGATLHSHTYYKKNLTSGPLRAFGGGDDGEDDFEGGDGDDNDNAFNDVSVSGGFLLMLLSSAFYTLIKTRKRKVDVKN